MRWVSVRLLKTYARLFRIETKRLIPIIFIYVHFVVYTMHIVRTIASEGFFTNSTLEAVDVAGIL